MRHLSLLLGISLFCVFLMTASPAVAASEVYTNRGMLSAVDLDHETVVVEVPVKSGLMTVGGTLTNGADLKRGGRPAKLNDFVKGEEVVVRWQYTETGHRILGLRKP